MSSEAMTDEPAEYYRNTHGITVNYLLYHGAHQYYVHMVDRMFYVV